MSAAASTVAEVVAATLAERGVRQVFGVVGSGNFHVTNALIGSGARYVAARHEMGATVMADAYARMSDGIGVVTLHQGCGLTNAVTGLAEAAKSGTPLLALAAEVTNPASNFYVDQPALARAVGAESIRVDDPARAAAQIAAAYDLAVSGRRTVLVNLPLQIQSRPVPSIATDAGQPQPATVAAPPDGEGVAELAGLLLGAQRPVFVAGRGARHARTEIERAADEYGALLATSAVVKGLFHGSPWSLDVSGGFATPLAANLIRDADLIVGWGCALNMWTMRHGRLIGPGTTVVQVDVDRGALGRHRDIDLGIHGDSAEVARCVRALFDGAARAGYRSDEVATRIAAEGRWRDVPYLDWAAGTGDSARIDPRTLTIGLDDLLPAERIVSVDSGNFMGYPSMFLSVPDELGFCFTQAFQSIGLGLATAIGAALARPDRLPVAALGDGGALMGIAELDTVRRLGLPMVVVVYNDAAYGAEVHHFSGGQPLETVTFPDTDIASIARGYGFDAVTVRGIDDLGPVGNWLRGPRERALLIDAKVAGPRGAWWLEEAFRGH
ncbi:MAG: thiamine pyrophosphate-binding protein [Actinomycetota bacterium]|nr:thiamine pyrophosphate-binding protein [Actinomycetota bacterium]